MPSQLSFAIFFLLSLFSIILFFSHFSTLFLQLYLINPEQFLKYLRFAKFRLFFKTNLFFSIILKACLSVSRDRRAKPFGISQLFIFVYDAISFKSIDHHVKFARFRPITHGFLDLLQFADLGSDNFEFCEI